MVEIVVGVDGSAPAAAALRWAAREAAGQAARLTAFLAWGLFDQPGATADLDPGYGAEDADRALLAALDAALPAAVAAAVEHRVVCDLPARALLAAAEGTGLLVGGSRGLGGFRGLLLGSVSHQCLHHSPAPLAIVRTDPDDAAGGRIVVGVDGSDPSRRALAWALAAARRRDAAVDVIHAWQPPALYGVVSGFPDIPALEDEATDRLDRVVGEVVASLGAEDVKLTTSVRPGGAAPVLLDAAAGADALVLGRRGIGGFARLLVGSVTEHVAHHSPCPLVVLPPEEDDG
jgi:nucleotide-binding universal stress UspA family protein